MAEIYIPYTIETPRGTLAFNTADANGDELRLSVVDGLDHPVLRTSVQNRPQAPGAIVFPSIDGARYPILRGHLRVVENGTETALLTRRRQLEDKLRSWLGSIKAEEGTLRWTPTGAPARRLERVQLIDKVAILHAGGPLKEFQVALVAGDPVVYSDTEFSQDTAALAPGQGAWKFPFTFPFSFGSSSSGGTTTVYNGGDEPAWPKVRIYGYCVAPRVKNLTSGLEVGLPGLSIGANDYVEVDMRSETVRLNGPAGDDLIGGLDVPGSRFWPLALDDNQVQLTAAAFQAGSKATLAYRYAFG